MSERVVIKRLASGVSGLDEVLGGGIPEFSFNLLAGGPGSGKTTLAHQIMFANATPDSPALYVSILGEPPLKMLRYQQQFGFFDHEKVGTCVWFLHLGEEVLRGGFETVLARILQEVQMRAPRTVFVDSFREITRRPRGPGEMGLNDLVQRLALFLGSWEVTSFLIGDFVDHEGENAPLLTVADGIVWMRQTVDRNSVVRRMQVLKMRGQEQSPGLHTFRLSDDGVHVYPRMRNPAVLGAETMPVHRRRLTTGIAGLDEMMGGGVPEGYALMVVGPSGSGKSLMSTQFILEGIRQNEPGVIAVFEKRPEEYLQTLPAGGQLAQLIHAGSVRMMYLRPLDLSVEEAMEELRRLILEVGAKRVVIDSLSGFEVALAPAYREDFRESLYRMVGALTGLGATVVVTCELIESYIELRLTPAGVAFLADGIVLQRYVEAHGALGRAMAVVKLRGCAHSKALRAYDIDDAGIHMGETLGHYGQVLTGVPLLDPGRDALRLRPEPVATGKRVGRNRKR